MTMLGHFWRKGGGGGMFSNYEYFNFYYKCVCVRANGPPPPGDAHVDGPDHLPEFTRVPEGLHSMYLFAKNCIIRSIFCASPGR